MMVALLIATVLMLLLVQLLQTATSAIISGEDRLYATNDAQAAMELLATDLQSIKAIQVPVSFAGIQQGESVEVLQGFGNGSPANPGVTLTPQGTTHPAISNLCPMDLYLLVTPPAGYSAGGTSLSGAGTPHLIRYKLVWQDPTNPRAAGTNPIMALYRDYVSSSATFGMGIAGAEVNNSVGIAGLHDLYTDYWSKTNEPPVTDLLISNVFDFQILLYDTGSRTPTIPINSPISVSASNYYYQPALANTGQTFHLSSQGLFINAPNPEVPPTPYSHLVAEIRMTLLSQQGVSIFNTGALDLRNTRVSEKYAHLYVRRVPISL
jgi:hypothetical protein